MVEFPLPYNSLEEPVEQSPMDEFPDIREPSQSYFRCCRCKYPLASAELSFSYTEVHGLSECTHIFLSNPVSWMHEQLDTTAPGGKLYCPKCEGKYHVGEYCWMGVQCQNAQCGEIVAPGLALIHRMEGDKLEGAEFMRVREEDEDDTQPRGQDSQESLDSLMSDSDSQEPMSKDEGPLHSRVEAILEEDEITSFNENNVVLDYLPDISPGLVNLYKELRAPGEDYYLPETTTTDENAWKTILQEISNARANSYQMIEEALRPSPQPQPRRRHFRWAQLPNPHFRPHISSPLRASWRPRSASSTPASSPTPTARELPNTA